MVEFDFWLLLYAIPAVIFAGWVHGALGLGFPMVATPLIAVFVDVKLAILITLLPTATVNVASVLTAKDLPSVVSKYLPLMLASLFGAVIGSMLLAASDPAPFRLALAALIILFLLTSKFEYRLPLKQDLKTMLFFGAVAGFAGGITNVMVAVLIIYFLSLKTVRSEMVPALNLCFLVGKSSQIVVFMALGTINFTWLIYTVPLALIAYISLKIGQSYGARIEVDKYRRILHVILLLLATVLVFQFWFNG